MIDLCVTFSEVVFVTALLSVIFIDHFCSSQICPHVYHVWLAACVSPVSGSCFALGWLVFHPPSDLDKRLGEIFILIMWSELHFVVDVFFTFIAVVAEVSLVYFIFDLIMTRVGPKPGLIAFC